MNTVASDYFYILGDPTVPESCTVSRTVQVNDRILLDLDTQGRVIGVESIKGLVDFEDLVEVLRKIEVKSET